MKWFRALISENTLVRRLPESGILASPGVGGCCCRSGNCRYGNQSNHDCFKSSVQTRMLLPTGISFTSSLELYFARDGHLARLGDGVAQLGWEEIKK